MVTRREFLKGAGIAIGGMALGGGIVAGIGSMAHPSTKEKHHFKELPEYNKALMFFTPTEHAVIEAAAERIFPKDENGPGAKELLVSYYIDHQLAGAWGNGSKEYRQGPFYPGEPTQGYQGHLNKQQIFRLGIEALQNEAKKRFNQSFTSLEGSQQDEILQAFEKGEVEIKGVSSSYFFSLLRSATLEGVYADPLYGGNRNMEGWRMKKFPGHQMSFADIIDKDEFVVIEPQSLHSQHHS
ncbi:gluconate 2-dehydrogenase subunit 3 family protein [Ureibacillus terrenus]|uniref:gluconate 2-dehydrogenase subunit 3 family protein n=1 Tax=Ureibacillus terrenus TaxID=118246 RepID=UPI002E1C419D|nr:gluconate 2-dehydrogenase subunit 3 family protein [Ureibacillus terrenus]